MSKIYKLSLDLKSGLLSELHSDIIFGHFCWRMKDFLGEEKLLEMLKLYLSGNPVFTISDCLFEKNNTLFFSRPFVIKKIDKKEKLTKKEKICNFLIHKTTKSVNLVNVEQFNDILAGKSIQIKKETSLPEFEYDLRVSAEIDRNKLSTKEGRLFSYAPKYIKKQKKEEKVNLALLVKVLDENKFDEFKCKEILKDVFEIGFGKKKSSGYGQFEIIDDFSEYNEIKEPENPNGFISLSHYLPSSSDSIVDGFYNVNVKYGKLGEELALDGNPFKKPIIFYTPGSCFKTDTIKEFYGRCTNSGEVIYRNEIVHYGFSFSIKMKY